MRFKTSRRWLPCRDRHGPWPSACPGVVTASRTCGRLARKRLPASIFDYIEGGGEDEVSLRRNRSSFEDWSFLPKWGSVENLDLSSTLLGGPVSMPLTMSPTGGTRLFHPDGEIAVARAARRCRRPVRPGASEHDAHGAGQCRHSRTSPMVQHRTRGGQGGASGGAGQGLEGRLRSAAGQCRLSGHRPPRAGLPQRIHRAALDQAQDRRRGGPAPAVGAGIPRQRCDCLPEPGRGNPRGAAVQHPGHVANAAGRFLRTDRLGRHQGSAIALERPHHPQGLRQSQRRRHRRRDRHRRHPGQQPRRPATGPHGFAAGRAPGNRRQRRPAGWKSSSTAASAAARTSSRPSLSAPTPVPSAARTSTVWRPPARPAWPTS